ncbi:MAG: glycosyltransferase family 4 protein [Pirellulaceae bacterium]
MHDPRRLSFSMIGSPTSTAASCLPLQYGCIALHRGLAKRLTPIAYAYEKPVIVTRIGGLPDMVDHGKTGLLIPPRDVRLGRCHAAVAPRPHRSHRDGASWQAQSYFKVRPSRGRCTNARSLSAKPSQVAKLLPPSPEGGSMPPGEHATTFIQRLRIDKCRNTTTLP